MFLMARVGATLRGKCLEKIAVFELDGELVERITQARFIASRTEISSKQRDFRVSSTSASRPAKNSSHLMLREVAQVDGPSEVKLLPCRFCSNASGSPPLSGSGSRHPFSATQVLSRCGQLAR
jgi:hypothetical protein